MTQATPTQPSPADDAYLRAALSKWPHVPACYGWLALDGRGDWYMRDEAAQRLGRKGSRIEHRLLLEFIERSYFSDENGAWYFQNGPQRVYVELEVCPLIARLQQHHQQLVCTTHHQQALFPDRALTDEFGHLYLAEKTRLACVHPQDLVLAAEHIQDHQLAWQQQIMPIEQVSFAELAELFHFIRHPSQTFA